MRAFAGCIILLLAVGAFPQDAPKLDVLHGTPGAEQFTARSGIGITAKYGSDGMACRIQVTKLGSPIQNSFAIENTMSWGEAQELMNEIVPLDVRGKGNPSEYFQSSACGMGEFQIFQNVTFVLGEIACLKPIRVNGINAYFTRPVCPSPERRRLPRISR